MAVVGNGKEVKEACVHNKADVVIMDNGAIDGWNLCPEGNQPNIKLLKTKVCLF